MRAARVKDGRILERGGHQVREAETALHEAGGNNERGTELGLVFVGGADFVFVRFGDDGHCLARQKGLGADNISAVDLIVQPDGRIGAAMDEVADRIGLDGGLREFPDRPQSGEFGREVDRRRRVLEVGIEEAEPALIGPRGRLEAVLGQAGGGDTGNGGPSRMHALGPRTFLQEDLDPGSGAGGDALGGDDGLGREIEQACGNDAGAEMGDDAGGMKAGVVEATLGGCADTDRGFHSRGVRHQ